MNDKLTLFSVGQANLKFLSSLAELASGAQFEMLRTSLATLATEGETLSGKLRKIKPPVGEVTFGQWPEVTPKVLIDAQTQVMQGFINAVLDVQKKFGSDSRAAYSEWHSEVTNIWSNIDQGSLINDFKNKCFSPAIGFFAVGKK